MSGGGGVVVVQWWRCGGGGGGGGVVVVVAVKETPYTRLCSTKKILTINGKFPGPTLYVHKGDTVIVDVYNKGKENITIHWHGVKQPKYPWTDGPEYITQCPVKPGAKFSQKIVLSTEEGTLWWHAHSDWSRATVHGAIIIYPKKGSGYPFPKPHAEVPIILDTFKLMVDHGKTYLLRLINAGMSEIMFFTIAKHQLTVVGTDASYTKPLKANYIAISPGQTIDALLQANQPRGRYYMAARVYFSVAGVPYDNNTTTTIIQYKRNYTSSSSPPLPSLPHYNDTNASVSFTGRLRSLRSEEHPVNVPLNISTKLIFTISVNSLPCAYNLCKGPNGTRFSASVNNISFVSPSIDILQAYYKHINGVYGANFPSYPPLVFNYTADYLPLELELPQNATEVKVLEYNSTVEIVLQGTNLVAGSDHPLHLHGYSFYVVGWGFGNFDKDKDPLGYNLVDPPLQNTIAVPTSGWAAISFKANNPGMFLQRRYFSKDKYSLRLILFVHVSIEPS
ncbi:hypothetical protein RHGRI_031898 [Rhododendron griersonianum]|uniref:laccase n=1 Tax=Rhododendron griersonianum TaxID=479676 RepID=A0AAV6IFG9_9ERIC|nr:hypothetical protein RHGRI_031898 [Rhododendron griersonianum]